MLAVLLVSFLGLWPLIIACSVMIIKTYHYIWKYCEEWYEKVLCIWITIILGLCFIAILFIFPFGFILAGAK